MNGHDKITGRYGVVIPAFDAAETIGSLVQRIKRLGFDPIVVNDGSSDQTAAIASQHGAIVISHLTNRGKGHALRSGFEYAQRMGYDGVVTMDSDGQHDPDEIPQLVRACEVQHAGIVLGNRMAADGTAMPRLRWRTNRFMSAIVSAAARQLIPDSQCGFRVIRKEVLQSVPVRAQRFEVETELLLKAAAKRWKIISVPVRTIYDDPRSHIKPVRDGIRFAWLILRHLLVR